MTQSASSSNPIAKVGRTISTILSFKVITFALTCYLSRILDLEAFGTAQLSWGLLEVITGLYSKEILRKTGLACKTNEASQFMTRIGQQFGLLLLTIVFAIWAYAHAPMTAGSQAEPFVYHGCMLIIFAGCVAQLRAESHIIRMLRYSEKNSNISVKIESSALFVRGLIVPIMLILQGLLARCLTNLKQSLALGAIGRGGLVNTLIDKTVYVLTDPSCSSLISLASSVGFQGLSQLAFAHHYARKLITPTEPFLNAEGKPAVGVTTHHDRNETKIVNASTHQLCSQEIHEQFNALHLRKPKTLLSFFLCMNSDNVSNADSNSSVINHKTDGVEEFKHYGLLAMQKFITSESERLLIIFSYPPSTWALYAQVVNLGSIPCRLLFAPIEDLATTDYLRDKYSQRVSAKRGFQAYFHLVLMSALTFVLIVRPISASLIYVLFGSRWITRGLHIALMRYLSLNIIIGINGQLEAFLYSTSSATVKSRLRAFNWILTVFGVALHVISYRRNSTSDIFADIDNCTRLMLCMGTMTLLRICVFLYYLFDDQKKKKIPLLTFFIPPRASSWLKYYGALCIVGFSLHSVTSWFTRVNKLSLMTLSSETALPLKTKYVWLELFYAGFGCFVLCNVALFSIVLR